MIISRVVSAHFDLHTSSTPEDTARALMQYPRGQYYSIIDNHLWSIANFEASQIMGTNQCSYRFPSGGTTNWSQDQWLHSYAEYIRSLLAVNRTITAPSKALPFSPVVDSFLLFSNSTVPSPHPPRSLLLSIRDSLDCEECTGTTSASLQFARSLVGQRGEIAYRMRRVTCRRKMRSIGLWIRWSLHGQWAPLPCLFSSPHRLPFPHSAIPFPQWTVRLGADLTVTPWILPMFDAFSPVCVRIRFSIRMIMIMTRKLFYFISLFLNSIDDSRIFFCLHL